MQRDQKVGLALGVLLIGAVAAFFFRNEPERAIGRPALENTADVDREIAEKRLTPYFSEIETDAPPRGTQARPASERQDMDELRTGERKLPRWEQAQTDKNVDPFAADAPGPKTPMPAPDPIRYDGQAADSSATVLPDHNHAWNPVGEAAVKTHEVQKGETLSSIAGKYLGSQTRFHEIFEANRNQLKDANDLQVGMKLRIPDAKAKPATVKSPPPTTRQKKAESAAVDPPVDDVPAAPVSIIETEDADIPADEQPAMKPADPPKARFTPAKRRPGR